MERKIFREESQKGRMSDWSIPMEEDGKPIPSGEGEFPDKIGIKKIGGEESRGGLDRESISDVPVGGSGSPFRNERFRGPPSRD